MRLASQMLSALMSDIRAGALICAFLGRSYFDGELRILPRMVRIIDDSYFVRTSRYPDLFAHAVKFPVPKPVIRMLGFA